jgi:hypothetical protein
MSAIHAKGPCNVNVTLALYVKIPKLASKCFAFAEECGKYILTGMGGGLK